MVLLNTKRSCFYNPKYVYVILIQLFGNYFCVAGFNTAQFFRTRI